MNLYANKYRELILWIPLGIISMLSFWIFREKPFPWLWRIPRLEYKLISDDMMPTSRGDSNSTRVLRYVAQERLSDGSPSRVSRSRWATLMLLSSDHDKDYNIQTFTNILSKAPMDAFFFETKGIQYGYSYDSRTTFLRKTSVNDDFEFVLVESSYLYDFADANQDAETFKERFATCKKGSSQENNNDPIGCVFPNPAGDSTLISPMQLDTANTNIYGHLAAFMRRAPADQVLKFWKLVIHTFLERLTSEDPEKVWLSTDGMGVAWLHVRLDPTPKYYDYGPYKNEKYLH